MGDGMTQPVRSEKNKTTVVYVDAEIKDLVPIFLRNRLEDVKCIFEACEQSNYEEIRVLGHNMKGTGSAYGFDAISEIGAALEQCAKERNSEKVRMLANEVSVYLEHVAVVYAQT